MTLRRSARWRAAVAGAAAGPSLLLTGCATRRDELALYFLLRGVTLLVRCGNKAPASSALRRALAPTRWEDGDAVMMCIATWQIIYSYVLLPQTLPRGYVRFLNRMAGFDSWLVPVARVRIRLLVRLLVAHAAYVGMAHASHQRVHPNACMLRCELEHWHARARPNLLCALARTRPAPPRGLLAQFMLQAPQHIYRIVASVQELALRNAGSKRHDPSVLASVPPALAPAVDRSDFCGLLHPTQPEHCNRHFAGILPTLFNRSLLVYLPVYMASALAVHRGQLLKRPMGIVTRLLLGTGRSSAFLALYVAFAHRRARLWPPAAAAARPRSTCLRCTWSRGDMLLAVAHIRCSPVHT